MARESRISQADAVAALQQTTSITKAAKVLGVPRTTFTDFCKKNGLTANGTKPDSSRDEQPSALEQMREAELNPPIDVDDKVRIRALEAENARLQQQITWAQQAEATTRTGGTLTIRRTDDHHIDKGHLLSCCKSLTEKLKVVIEQYKPDRIQVVGWDDWIAGTGIFREQDLETTTTVEDDQVAIGAMKGRYFLAEIREVSDAPITCRVLRGNHNFCKGVSMTETLFLKSRTLCEDLLNVNWVYHHDNATVNLAHDGTYNVLVRHGFGYSKHSPNSPAFIDTIKDELLIKQRKQMPGEQYRRVLSGHTHWLTVGLERLQGLYFDTTGGLQRNSRIRIGDNQRPVGWIVYVSLPGMDSEILQPIALRPDDDTYEREIADPHLASDNMRDAQQCLREARAIMETMGLYAEAASFGKLNEGRW